MWSCRSWQLCCELERFEVASEGGKYIKRQPNVTTVISASIKGIKVFIFMLVRDFKVGFSEPKIVRVPKHSQVFGTFGMSLGFLESKAPYLQKFWGITEEL